MSGTPDPGSTPTLHALETMSVLHDLARAAGHTPGIPGWDRSTLIPRLHAACARCRAWWAVSPCSDRLIVLGDWVLEPCSGGAS